MGAGVGWVEGTASHKRTLFPLNGSAWSHWENTSNLLPASYGDTKPGKQCCWEIHLWSMLSILDLRTNDVRLWNGIRSATKSHTWSLQEGGILYYYLSSFGSSFYKLITKNFSENAPTPTPPHLTTTSPSESLPCSHNALCLQLSLHLPNCALITFLFNLSMKPWDSWGQWLCLIILCFPSH